MIRAISFELAKLLHQDMPFIDRAAGAVQVAEKQIVSDMGTRLEKFAVADQYLIRGQQECNAGPVIPFTPDTALKGMLYFEDGGVTPGQARAGMLEMTGRVRMVCWLNPQLFQAEVAAQLSLQAQSTAISILTAIKTRSFGPILAASVRVARVVPQDSAIFSKYTYSVSQSQYLLLPFQYFAFDLDITFRIKAGCSPVVSSNPCP